MKCNIYGCNEEAVMITKGCMSSGEYCERHFYEIYHDDEFDYYKMMTIIPHISSNGKVNYSSEIRLTRNTMKFDVCNFRISKRLSELGVKWKSQYVYTNVFDGKITEWYITRNITDEKKIENKKLLSLSKIRPTYYHAYSYLEISGKLPIRILDFVLRTGLSGGFYVVEYVNSKKQVLLRTMSESFSDAVGEMAIKWLMIKREGDKNDMPSM